MPNPMLKMRRFTLMLSVILIVTIGMTGGAQEDNRLVIFANDVFLAGDADGVQPFTTCTPDERVQLPMVAIHADYFVIVTEPASVSERLALLGGGGGLPIPSNFYLCHIPSGILTKIADQPDDFSFLEEAQPDKGITRSSVIPSPDGQSIAWTEMTNPGFMASIQILDLATLTTSRIPLALPDSFSIPVAPQLFWFDNGLATLVYALDDVTFEALTQLHFIDPDGTVSRIIEVSREGETSDFIDSYQTVQYEGRSWLALRFSESGWALLDPINGEKITPEGLPALVASDHPDRLTLYMDVDENYNTNWQAVGANTRIFDNYMMQRIALSPDGQQVAFAGSVLEVWDSSDNSVREIAGTEGFADDFRANVIWGASEWVWATTSTTTTQILPDLPTCAGTQASRLRPNTVARVAEPTIPNNVRDTASTSGALVGQIPGGATFTVLAGPVCADGYAWYQIQLGALTGWTAEGTSDIYWLEPIN